MNASYPPATSPLEAAGRMVPRYTSFPTARHFSPAVRSEVYAGWLSELSETSRREIVLVAEKLGPVEISHVHWGGGTPNILPPDCFETLVRDLSEAFRFRPDMGHAIELDSRHVTPEKCAASRPPWRQPRRPTLDPAVQQEIARVHRWPPSQRGGIPQGGRYFRDQLRYLFSSGGRHSVAA